MDQMYKSKNNDPAACASAGGILTKAPNSAAQSKDCKEILHQAGPQGTGIITLGALADPKSTSRSGLSVPQSIGLAVAVLLVVMVSAIGFLWPRRKKERSMSIASKDSEGTDNFGKVELPTNSIYTEKKLGGMAELDLSPVSPNSKWGSAVETHERIEIDSDEKFEMDVGTGYIEMPTDYNMRVELEDSSMKLDDKKRPPSY
jgi:hypothetical protein